MKKSTNVEKILDDIKAVKIQGAENIARAGIRVFLMSPTKKTAQKLKNVRPTEPLLHHALDMLLFSTHPSKTAEKFLNALKKAHTSIAKRGAALVKNDMNIYVHCHSSTVMDILKYAKTKQKKNFVVYTTEVEPKLQGRLTAQDLARSRINVIIFPDLAAEQALQHCDLFFFGADALTKKHVVNKLGTHMLTKIAGDYRIPRYCASVSGKFTKKVTLEQRSPRELWGIRNKKITIENPAFDKTPYKSITGIISEYGLLPPKEFVRKVSKRKI